MPLYEYQCKECGFITEIMHKISENPEVKCPQCSNQMKKLISPSAFHLKGSGWYVTDYARKSTNKLNKNKENNICSKSCETKKAANA